MQRADKSYCAEESICELCVKDNPVTHFPADEGKEVVTSERKRPDDTEGGSCD